MEAWLRVSSGDDHQYRLSADLAIGAADRGMTQCARGWNCGGNVAVAGVGSTDVRWALGVYYGSYQLIRRAWRSHTFTYNAFSAFATVATDGRHRASRRHRIPETAGGREN